MHVEQVLGDVPAAERCRCRESSETTSGESWVAKLAGLFKT